MKKIKLPLLLSALVLSGLSFTHAAPANPAYDLLADLGTVPGYEVVLSTPI